MNDRRALTFAEYAEEARRIYDDMMARKRAARKAEADYWNEANDIQVGLEDIAANLPGNEEAE